MASEFKKIKTDEDDHIDKTEVANEFTRE